MPARDFAGRTDRSRTAREVGLAFAGATAAASVLYHLQGIPFIHENLTALVGVMFLLLPHLLLRGRADIADYGFTTQPIKLNLIVLAVAIALVLPLFTAGFALFYRGLCAVGPQLVPGSCFRVLHPMLRWPPKLGTRALAQLVVVGLPEELFFRGYLQGRLEDAWPPKWKLLGAPVGGAWIVTAALFALGHFLVTFEPSMLTRFFPGLVFGWMYARTRSVAPGAAFHASCNLLIDVLGRSFLG